MKNKLVTALIVAAALAMPATISAKDKAVKAPVAVEAPAAGMGQIVFFRPGNFIGGAIACTVRENGQMIGNLSNGKYFIVPFAPGKHVFTTKTEATDTLNMEVESGETYYVRCGIGMGLVAGRPNLAPSDKATFDEKSAKMKVKDAAQLGKEQAKDAAKKK
jgi:uncharacterized membrane protein